jgi:hypothetical protein
MIIFDFLPFTVFAYYGRSKILLASLLVLLVAEFGAMVALVATALPKAHIIANPLRDINAGPCVGISIPFNFNSLWYVKSVQILLMPC